MFVLIVVLLILVILFEAAFILAAVKLAGELETEEKNEHAQDAEMRGKQDDE